MRGWPLLCGVAVLALPMAASAQQSRPRITPHIEASQVLTADLQSGDVLTYSTLGAGVDVSVQSRRVRVQLDYNYQHRFGYGDRLSDSYVHSGLGRAEIDVARGVRFDASALATRTRADIRGAAPTLLVGDADNITQIYSVDLGPSVESAIGPVRIDASYRLGYTHADSPGVAGISGQPAIDYFGNSTRQSFAASATTRPGRMLPVGITISGSVNREDASQLDQRYLGRNIGGELLWPFVRTIALVAGAGYEEIRVSQRDPLTDALGNPVIGDDGRFVTAPGSPRRTAYATDNPLYWNAGLIWRPSHRTELETRIGRRYDSWSYTGSFTHEIGEGSGIRIAVYDGIQSFGRQLGGALDSLPTRFGTEADTFSNNYNGCVFGTAGNAVGGCLNGALQSLAAANYRARGVDGVIAFNRGQTRLGLGLGYTQRRFFAPQDAAGGATIDGVTDRSYYVQAFAARALSPVSSLTGNLYANYFDGGPGTATPVWSVGANAAYARSFGRLAASLSAGLFTYQRDGADMDISVQALLGLGYDF
ncbi:hypothetical protein EV664_11123 [Stakelama pacifica]|uniref:Preprotein translocase subunit YajC n=2 Tax=Stakelama pacifica TaxID=517720 RepID=A0A4V3BSS7_9SPHN|nr:hypothetical protein EV664_11123 [Stakelama pacifica]GGO98058.1 hypothetical protein GCM10011329_28330 [Stakelama pacifica]